MRIKCCCFFQSHLEHSSVAIVLDSVWIFDPLFFSLDFINKCLDFSSLENCSAFHAYQTMCSPFQNHSLWY